MQLCETNIVYCVMKRVSFTATCSLSGCQNMWNIANKLSVATNPLRLYNEATHADDLIYGLKKMLTSPY